MNTTAPALQRQDAIDIVGRLAAAKSRQDIEAAAAMYHPDAVLESPPLGTHHEGSAIRAALERWDAFAPDYEVRIDGYGLDGETMDAWGEIAFTPAFTGSGAVPDGRRATVPVFILFRFRDGLVAWESFHFDVAAVARQCGVTASDLVAVR